MRKLIGKLMVYIALILALPSLFILMVSSFVHPNGALVTKVISDVLKESCNNVQKRYEAEND